MVTLSSAGTFSSRTLKDLTLSSNSCKKNDVAFKRPTGKFGTFRQL